MSDWQVGDLAVGDDNLPYCPACEADLAAGREAGDTDGVLLVIATDAPDPEYGETEPGLVFAGDVGADPWCACQFRKIRPDEQQACEPEFVTLLKRSKVKETASDWLLRVGPLAKRLNLESQREEESQSIGKRRG